MAATQQPGAPAQRDIACFVQVARELSFSRAAVALGLSQPAVSQAIARLERALGLSLFDRTSREVHLTDAGKGLLPYAETLLDHVGAFVAEAARLAAGAGPPIRLAYCPLVGGLAARAARRLARRVPAVEVELRRAGWAEASAALTGGSVSAALMSTPHPAGLASTARFHVPVDRLAVPAAWPLASSTRVVPGQLAGLRLLVPHDWPPGGLWSAVAAALRTAAVRPAFVPADLDDLPGALDLVAAGRGALLAPHLLASTVRRPDVRFVPLAGTGELRLTYGLVWPGERPSAELMALVQAVRAILRLT